MCDVGHNKINNFKQLWFSSVLCRLHDVSSKHGTLESEFDTLKVKQDDLEKQLEEKMRQEELGKLQDQTEGKKTKEEYIWKRNRYI